MSAVKQQKPKQAPPAPLTEEQRLVRQQLKRMRKRCAILSISQLNENDYQVWGGSKVHNVHVTPDGYITCDCLGWYTAMNGNCSHVVKYRLVYGDLKK